MSHAGMLSHSGGPPQYVWRVGPTCPIMPIAEDLTEQYITSPFSSFLIMLPFGWKDFKLEYPKNLSSEFHEIFLGCSHPVRPGNTGIFSASPIWGGAMSPQIWE